MAAEIRKILYATDLTANAGYAFRYAVSLAKSSGGENLGCDLIVIGSHEHGVSHTFLGSIAKRVLRRTRIPALVVPLLEDN